MLGGTTGGETSCPPWLRVGEKFWSISLPCATRERLKTITGDMRETAIMPCNSGVGDTRIVTSSATPANRHFRSCPQSGNDADIAEPTRFTRSRRPHWPWPSCKITHQLCTGVLHGKCSDFPRPWIWNEIVDFCGATRGRVSPEEVCRLLEERPAFMTRSW